MRVIAIIRIAAIAGAIAAFVSSDPAKSQSPNERARCLSIADVDSRVDCLENLRGRAQTAPSPMQRISPQEDRELDCRNPQDASLCREYERQQGIRSGGPQLPTGAYRPPPAQAPAQYGRPQPSFNCARAATVIEQAICSDATLAQWDARMGQLYREALSIQNNSPTLIGDQSRWRALRNSNCSRTNLSETKSCVLAMTKARVGGLAAVVTANGRQPNSSEPTAAPVPNPWPAYIHLDDATEAYVSGLAAPPGSQQAPARTMIGQPAPPVAPTQSTEAAQQADPYANDYRQTLIAAYYRERATFLSNTRYYYLAAGCKAIDVAWPITADESQMLGRSFLRLPAEFVDKSLQQEMEQAMRDGTAQSRNAGACDYFHEHPDQVVILRQLLSMH
jgi:uncharacterized protein YecT (DUF1311 family)